MTNSETKPKALIADDEEGIRFVLRQLLIQENCQVDLASDGEEAFRLAEAGEYDLYLFDVKMPRIDGLTLLRRVRRLRPDAMIVMVTAFGSQKLAIEALMAGAYDYFTKPFELDELRIILRRALEKHSLLKRVQTLERQLVGGGPGMHEMVGETPAMRHVFDLVRRVASHDITVLITGESGVGKELVSSAIHELGSGPEKPFVKVNCAAIPEPLLESELFGHEKGAFTGAYAAKPGKFEIANGGSILLDEIGEMPLSLQAKLLRVIQEKQVERIGDTRSRPINLRIMASTNRDLAVMVKEKTFREDLYYRLNVVPIPVPSLRQRREDLPALIQHFLEKHGSRGGRQIIGFTPEAMALLEAYDWPGNVRELENVIQRAMVMASGPMIDPEALPGQIRGEVRVPLPAEPSLEDDTLDAPLDVTTCGSLDDAVKRVVETTEKQLIEAALRIKNGHRQETADLLAISRKSLHNKMVKYGLGRDREDTGF